MVHGSTIVNTVNTPTQHVLYSTHSTLCTAQAGHRRIDQGRNAAQAESGKRKAEGGRRKAEAGRGLGGLDCAHRRWPTNQRPMWLTAKVAAEGEAEAEAAEAEAAAEEDDDGWYVPYCTRKMVGALYCADQQHITPQHSSSSSSSSIIMTSRLVLVLGDLFIPDRAIVRCTA